MLTFVFSFTVLKNRIEMINNRELSWLSFNQRVLQEAKDCSVPLLQRLRFLGIFSNNQDEFIKVRVADIVKSAQLKTRKKQRKFERYTPRELLIKMNEQIENQQKEFISTYQSILREMETEGLFIINEKQLSKTQELFCRNYFASVISMRLVPLILRKSTQIPFLPDNNIYHAIKMYDSKKSAAKYAIIRIPVSSACPRFIELPSAPGQHEIIFSDDIIRLCLNDIFFMFTYDRISAYTFKIMRDAEFSVDDDISKSLMGKLEDGIESRMYGRPIRMIYDREMPDDLLVTIASKLKLQSDGALDAGSRYHLMRDLMKFPNIRPDLENINPPALQHPAIKRDASILKVIRKKDVFLNYPYHTFNHFIDFLREAAIDPKVESIFITLYRTAENSHVINTLINAAKNGKKVVAVIELLARFDEEQNVKYSELLHREGVRVIHGINGMKVHSKMALVERKERSLKQQYAYIGTGNFNEITAKIYTDFGLFTCQPQIVSDVLKVFDFLMDNHRHFKCEKLLVSPYFMRHQFKKLIQQEIKNAQKGKKASIHAKFNSLTDEEMINLLYKASQAGVEVRLIIRGACCLQPEQKGLSENIRAISIVDQYLEHTRMVIFYNQGDEKIFILSADWMKRNLDFRFETGVPIEDKNIRETLKTLFQLQWSDNVKARDLNFFKNNTYIASTSPQTVRSQIAVYHYYNSI
jgi:polyphosphate kinase